MCFQSVLPLSKVLDNPAIYQRGLADDQAAAMAEGLSICDMQQQYEVAKRLSFMEGLN